MRDWVDRVKLQPVRLRVYRKQLQPVHPGKLWSVLPAVPVVRKPRQLPGHDQRRWKLRLPKRVGRVDLQRVRHGIHGSHLQRVYPRIFWEHVPAVSSMRGERGLL